MTDRSDRFADREVSWLAFNERVLQEAEDPRVPLIQRLHFLAIYSSNLDEFFRVRVASLRSLMRLKPKRAAELGFVPAQLLRDIGRTVARQQERFGEVWRTELLPALRQEGFDFVDDRTVAEAHCPFLASYFAEQVKPLVRPVRLEPGRGRLDLKNRTSYLVTELWEAGDEPQIGILEVPAPPLPRFLLLPADGERRAVIFVDDVLRLHLDSFYPYTERGATYAVKLSRDADLYLEDEFSGDLVQMIRKNLAKRDTGMPCRFLYDQTMPFALVAQLERWLGLDDEDMVPGGRYHNWHDFFAFPASHPNLLYEPQPPHPVPALDAAPSLFAAMDACDWLLHFPYHSFGYVVRFFEEAAADPETDAIWVSLYRLASDSAVAKALIEARRGGKKVTVFVEVKARFDEATNLYWVERMEEAGVRVLYSLPGLKVHAKIALIRRRVGGKKRLYAYLGTGNFNEKTARLYVDEGLLTADPRLTRDVLRVFRFLEGKKESPPFDALLVAPFTLRQEFYRKIDREIEHARAGWPSGIFLKMNSLEDEPIIRRLYEASRAGVPIRIVVRGICRLVPGVPGQSETIVVTSIVDRYLEHARVYVFHNGGEPEYFLASADWMQRNLSRRVEVAFPLLDPRLRQEMQDLIDLQMADNTKARVIDAGQSNGYVPAGTPAVRAQYASYALLTPPVSGGDPTDR